ncbi:MAG: hypothetical protein KatS3mg109_0072 [Pirellulaceae bacterium]|nr:MAG: hypothetical protein KatS3mg109_0072 [Pirellulaceae bacterium]
MANLRDRYGRIIRRKALLGLPGYRKEAAFGKSEVFKRGLGWASGLWSRLTKKPPGFDKVIGAAGGAGAAPTGPPQLLRNPIKWLNWSDPGQPDVGRLSSLAGFAAGVGSLPGRQARWKKPINFGLNMGSWMFGPPAWAMDKATRWLGGDYDGGDYDGGDYAGGDYAGGDYAGGGYSNDHGLYTDAIPLQYRGGAVESIADYYQKLVKSDPELMQQLSLAWLKERNPKLYEAYMLQAQQAGLYRQPYTDLDDGLKFLRSLGGAVR